MEMYVHHVHDAEKIKISMDIVDHLTNGWKLVREEHAKEILRCKKEDGLKHEKESYVRLMDELSRERLTLRAGNKRRVSRRYQKRKHSFIWRIMRIV